MLVIESKVTCKNSKNCKEMFLKICSSGLANPFETTILSSNSTILEREKWEKF